MTYLPLSNPLTLVGDLRVAESGNRIDLSGFNDISVLRNTVVETGSATVVQTAGEVRLRTTASGADECSIASTERVKFDAGSHASVLITGRRPTAPTGNIDYRAGMFDADNGFGFGEDSTSPFVFDRSGGTETKVALASWNGDKLDGTGPSGITADFSQGVFMIIEFDCYCYGTIVFKLKVYNSATGLNEIVTIHTLRKTSVVQTQNPNVPVAVELANNATATAYDIFFGVRSFRSYTQNRPDVRYTGQYRLNQTPSTTFIPVISFRRKSGFEQVKALISGFSTICDTNLLLQIRVDGALTGASYATPTDHSATETALEQDDAATAITGGEVVWESLAFGGAKNNDQGEGNSALIPLDLPEMQPVTLCVRTTAGTATRLDSVFRIIENW